MAFSFAHRTLQPVEENRDDIFEPRNLGTEIFASVEARLGDEIDFDSHGWRYLGMGPMWLTLPELANGLHTPTEEDFQYWYNDPAWRAMSEGEEYVADYEPRSRWTIEEEWPGQFDCESVQTNVCSDDAAASGGTLSMTTLVDSFHACPENWQDVGTRDNLNTP